VTTVLWSRFKENCLDMAANSVVWQSLVLNLRLRACVGGSRLQGFLWSRFKIVLSLLPSWPICFYLFHSYILPSLCHRRIVFLRRFRFCSFIFSFSAFISIIRKLPPQLQWPTWGRAFPEDSFNLSLWAISLSSLLFLSLVPSAHMPRIESRIYRKSKWFILTVWKIIHRTDRAGGGGRISVWNKACYYPQRCFFFMQLTAGCRRHASNFTGKQESLYRRMLNILHSNYIKTIPPAETACIPHQRPCTPDLVIILSYPVLLSWRKEIIWKPSRQEYIVATDHVHADGMRLSLNCDHQQAYCSSFIPRVIWVQSATVEWYWQGKPKMEKKTCPSATLSTTNPTWTKAGANPVLRGDRPVTNRLSYGTAFTTDLKQMVCDS
jgi:hypothetical protein